MLDLDGVVVDSMPVHELTWRRYLESLGIAASDVSSRMHGRRNDEIFRDFLGPDADPRDILAHGAAKERIFREMMRDRLGPYPVPGIAAWLQRTAGIPVAVARNAERPHIAFRLVRANPR